MGLDKCGNFEVGLLVQYGIIADKNARRIHYTAFLKQFNQHTSLKLIKQSPDQCQSAVGYVRNNFIHTKLQ